MSMSDVQILHAIPGRIRIKIGKVKQDPTFARELERTLAGLQVVRWATVNSLTGSVLIGYDTAQLPDLRALQAGELPDGIAATELLSLVKVLGLLPLEGDLDALLAWIQRQASGTAWSWRAAEWLRRVLQP